MARAVTPPTLTEITAATGLPRSTSADLLAELRLHGYLRRTTGVGYRLGPRTQVLGLLAGLGPPSPIDHSRLEELSRVARAPLALAVLVGGEVLYLDAAGPRAPERIQQVADRHQPRPALRTAAGRLLLAVADEADRAPVLRAVAETDPAAAAAFIQERPAIERARLARSDGNGPAMAALVVLGPRRLSNGSTPATADLALEQAAARVAGAV